jgi:hypothetical protein
MDWKNLTDLTGGSAFVVERVRLASGIAIEGTFELPLLAQLPLEDQVFLVAFVRSHGSIKEMERLFGVSYPTIKARLNKLSERVGPVVDVEPPANEEDTSPAHRAILDRLDRGEISVQQALKELGS